ncbi:MAG: amidohydrolase family protein, partial [Acidimicrobiia bacterium]|nr:amidohydrolase family protein [Acidimicrobiia bacterium]
MYNQRAIDVGLGRRFADKVIRGGLLVNVLTAEIYAADVAISDDRIAAVGDVDPTVGADTEIIDASGMHLVPGLIDPHVHTEVTKMSITSYAKAVLPRGTTSVCTAFDQIAPVKGIDGIRYMLDEAAELPLRIFNPPPCKIPYTIPPSTLGASVGPDDHRIALDWPEAAGIAETTFDFINATDADVIESIGLCEERNLPVHGHAPFVTGLRLAAYANCGARDDHECFSKEETIDKLRNGLFCLLREATMAHNLADCIKAVTEAGLPTRRVCLCSDDTDTQTLVRLGHMDHIVRVAMSEGIDSVTAIQMATINPADALRIDDVVGSIAPGRHADILFVPDLESFEIAATLVGGEKVAEDGRMSVDLRPPERPAELLHTFSLTPVEPDDLVFRTDYDDGRVEAISMNVPPEIPLRLRRDVELEVRDGVIAPDPGNDVLYVSVVERYNDTGSRATAFMSGFNLREGALATSLSPDDENVVCIGADTQAMATAINRVIELDGG